MGINTTMYLPFSNWSLKPRHGEPAHGYFLRLVANEGHYSASVYANEIGLNGRRLTPEETLGALLVLPIGDDHKDALRLSSPIADGAYYDLGGQRLRQRQMSFSTRRFCRACLAESPYHRVWWDVLSFRTCPEHGTTIEDVDAFGQPIGWWWADIASDTSGNPLAASAVSRADRHARSLEAFVLERLGAAPKTSWPLLEPYELFEVIEACEYLGMWLGNERTSVVPANPMEKLAVGMAALEGAWDALVGAMRAWFMERVPSEVRRAGKMESMGWAGKARPKLPGTEIGDMLKRATTEAFEPIGKMGKKRFRETADFYAERALSPVAEELNVRMDALLPLARHLGIVHKTPGAWMVTSNQADILRGAVAGMVTSSEVTGILGLETWEWQDLVTMNRLTSFGHFGVGRFFLRSDVQGFVAETLNGVPRSDATSVSLRTYARRTGTSAGAVLIQVLEGNLIGMRSSGGNDLRAVRVVAESRRRAGFRTPCALEAPEAVTLAEAMVIIRFSYEVISRLVEVGAIEKTEDGLLRRASVVEFHGRYVNAQIYRAVLCCSMSEVPVRMAEIGVPYCFGIGGLNVVVERAPARRALGLAHDPDDPAFARNDLWEEFRRLVSERCSVFMVPPTVSALGAKLRTATRKVAVDATVDTTTGAIRLSFDLHPIVTPRRWKILEKQEAEIRAALGFLEWESTDGDDGWRLVFVALKSADLSRAVDVLIGVYRFFK